MRKVGLCVAVLLIWCSVIPFYFSETANANPISIDQFTTGTTIGLANNLSMPSADVRISISSVIISSSSYSRVYNHTVTMNSEFHIISSTSQDAGIAFAYPDTWGMTYREVSNLNMQIRLNETSVPYIVLAGSNLVIPESLDLSEELDYLRLAVINVSLSEETTYSVEVDASFQISQPDTTFRFRYFVGSARSWEGQTHETVELIVENSNLLGEVSFSPADSLQVSNAGISRIGMWTLDFSSFPYDYVECGFEQYTYTDPAEYIIYALSVSALVVGGIMVLFLIIRKKR
ncbi:MAG: hypothetical protein RTU30_04190 [Candidatus Thorarchaeota archaeon]